MSFPLRQHIGLDRNKQAGRPFLELLQGCLVAMVLQLCWVLTSRNVEGDSLTAAAFINDPTHKHTHTHKLTHSCSESHSSNIHGLQTHNKASMQHMQTLLARFTYKAKASRRRTSMLPR
jgi:ABC-type nickel/cobalt efflux system permease component RcnA